MSHCYPCWSVLFLWLAIFLVWSLHFLAKVIAFYHVESSCTVKWLRVETTTAVLHTVMVSTLHHLTVSKARSNLWTKVPRLGHDFSSCAESLKFTSLWSMKRVRRTQWRWKKGTRLYEQGLFSRDFCQQKSSRFIKTNKKFHHDYRIIPLCWVTLAPPP